METIIAYLKQKYHPLGIVVYGSFADGSNNVNSDFDALLITESGEKGHDNSRINGIELDVWIRPKYLFQKENKINFEDYIQLENGKVVLDKDGTASKLLNAVQEYVDSYIPKSWEENRVNVEWCEKMLLRTRRNDTEGYFRWHWLLVDSLEIYYDICGKRYKGPKKSISILQTLDTKAAEIYGKALCEMNYEALEEWIGYLRKKINEDLKV